MAPVASETYARRGLGFHAGSGTTPGGVGVALKTLLRLPLDCRRDGVGLPLREPLRL